MNKAIAEISKTLNEQYQKTIKILTDLYKQLYDGFNERVLPQLKESFKGIELILRNLYDETLNLGLNLFEKVVEQLKKFEPEFKKLGEITTEWAKKISDAANKYLDLIRKEIDDIYKLIVDALKSLPGFDALKEKAEELYKSFVVPENIVMVLTNIADTLKDALNQPDLDELLKSIISYIEKVILCTDPFEFNTNCLLFSVAHPTETEERTSQRRRSTQNDLGQSTEDDQIVDSIDPSRHFARNIGCECAVGSTNSRIIATIECGAAAVNDTIQRLELCASRTHPITPRSHLLVSSTRIQSIERHTTIRQTRSHHRGLSSVHI